MSVHPPTTKQVMCQSPWRGNNRGRCYRTRGYRPRAAWRGRALQEKLHSAGVGLPTRSTAVAPSNFFRAELLRPRHQVAADPSGMLASLAAAVGRIPEETNGG